MNPWSASVGDIVFGSRTAQAVFANPAGAHVRLPPGGLMRYLRGRSGAAGRADVWYPEGSQTGRLCTSRAHTFPVRRGAASFARHCEMREGDRSATRSPGRGEFMQGEHQGRPGGVSSPHQRQCRSTSDSHCEVLTVRTRTSGLTGRIRRVTREGGRGDDG